MKSICIAAIIFLNISGIYSQNLQNLHWKERGPYHIGGRTRSVAFDISNDHVILAGGVSGGLWRSGDKGQNWERVSPLASNQSVTSIAQDTRPGFTHIWYYTTGEAAGNSSSGVGNILTSFYVGNGIYRSTDGGITWRLLRSTSNQQNLNFLNHDFSLSWRVIVNPVNGHVYVATFGGIYKSTDQGENWREVLDYGNNAFANQYTDIACSSRGILYATISSAHNQINNKGIFRSINGEQWTNLVEDTPLPNGFQRIVMDIAPSNENKVYFFASTPNQGVGGYMLLKYTYLNDDGLGNNGRWENLTPNLNEQMYLAQGAYNQVIKVKPDNDNIVFLGSVNLYRSTDGFSSSENIHLIGGKYYGINLQEDFKNHHADQHDLAFSPEDANLLLSAHDGGLSMTLNCSQYLSKEAPVQWLSLNSGYKTSQAFSVAMDQSNFGNRSLCVGFQDNGTWLVKNESPESHWEKLSEGDGYYTGILQSGSCILSGNLYSAKLTRTKFDGHGQQIQKDVFNVFQQFSPFVSDPDNGNTLYIGAGNHIKRHNNIIEGDQEAWESLPSTFYEAGLFDYVSCLEHSRGANKILVFGTSNGMVFKVRNPHLANAEVFNITGADFPEDAKVSCVAIDPANPEHIGVVFSDYNIQNMFYSEDGGQSWVTISGNMAQNREDAGSSPSIRWLNIQRVDGYEGAIYWLGTSAGLYASGELNRENTIWEQVARNTIGNAIIPMIRSRRDGFLAVATHGNGTFSTFVGEDHPPMLVKKIDRIEVYRNHQPISIDLTDRFADPDNHDQLRISLLSNSNSALLQAELTNDQLHLNFVRGQSGYAQITIRAQSNGKFTDEKISIHVKTLQAIAELYEQANYYAPLNGEQAGIYTITGNARSAIDDFVVPDDQEWRLSALQIFGFTTGDPEFSGFQVNVYHKDNEQIGEGVFAQTIPMQRINFIRRNPRIYEAIIFLNQAEILRPGAYWLNVCPIIENEDDHSWSWSYYFSNGLPGNALRINEDGQFENINKELTFKILGTSNGTYQAPHHLEARSIYGKNIALQWEMAATYPVPSGFYIERASDDNIDFQRIATVDGITYSFTDQSDLVRGTRYTYRVKAFGLLRESAYSASATAQITSVPQNPRLRNITMRDNNLLFADIRWEDRSDDEDGFRIKRSFYRNKGFADYKNLSRNSEWIGGTHSLELKQYFYYIQSFNSNGNSEKSNIKTAFTGLFAPIDFLARAEARGNLLTWVDRSEHESAYEIYRSENGRLFEKIGEVNADTERFLDEQIERNEYTYKIRAISNKAYSSFSKVVMVKRKKLPVKKDIKKEALAKVDLSFSGNLLYPNPSNGIFNISNSKSLSESRFLVYDLQGRCVWSTDMAHEGILDLSVLKSGHYIVVFWVGAQRQSQAVWIK